MFTRIPKAFLPDEDQGIMFVQVTAPPGATISHTDEALRQIREYLLNDEKQAVKSVFTISGFNFSGRGQNSGLAFVSLKDWAERSGRSEEHTSELQSLMRTPNAVFCLNTKNSNHNSSSSTTKH